VAAAGSTLFATLYPLCIESYGLGVMAYDFRTVDAEENDVWLGHSGGSAGASAVIAWSPQRRAFVAVALTGSGSPQATALLLLKALPRPARPSAASGVVTAKQARSARRMCSAVGVQYGATRRAQEL
jgi:hypothetical protein